MESGKSTERVVMVATVWCDTHGKGPMARFGYLRVSTGEQRPDRQIDGLESICDDLSIECASASSLRRPVYEDLVNRLQVGDHLVVWSLDRAYRSTIDALLEIEKLKMRGISLEIVDMKIDTDTPGGMLMYTVLSAFAEFERQTLSQRTKEGIAAARARGKRIGRPPKLDDKQVERALHRIKKGTPVSQVAVELGVAPWSLSRAIKRLRVSQAPVSE